MDATNNIATDLFYKIRSRFTGLKLGESTGAITINPEQARFFDFDYIENDKTLGHVSISLAEPNSMKVYFSSGITEGLDSDQKDNWYGFLRELRKFAKRRLLAFDTRDIAKDNLDKRDYAFLSQHSTPQSDNDTIIKPVGEGLMNESNLYGTKTQSFQKLMDTRLIIKHSKKLADDFEQKPGDRSRNISALFVENQDGERFKYPFIHLAGARAMQRHVANGGLPYDTIGESLIRMSEEIAQLKSFTNYCVRNDLMNSDTNNIVERSKSQLDGLRERIAKLSKQAHYENYVTEFQAPEAMEVPDDVMEEYKEKFTVRNFKEDLTSVFPVLYRLMKEEETIGYDDIVGMTGMEETTDTEEEKVSEDPMSEFENWVNALGEESPLTMADEEQKSDMVKRLNGLLNTEFQAGVDGTNAITSLEGIIEDPKLEQDIKKAEPEQDVRPMVKAWVEENAPDVLGELDFGDMVDEPAAGADAVEPQQEEGVTNEAISLDQAREHFFDKHDFADENIQGEYDNIANKMSPEDAEILKKELEEFYPDVTFESVNEGESPEVTDFFNKVADGGSEGFDMLYDANSGKGVSDAVYKAVSDMYNDVAVDNGYHADDDFEKIYDRMMDYIEADYGTNEGITDKFKKDPSLGMNKYGLAAIKKDGMFFSIKDKKITGGPFDSIDELRKHQEELMNKDSDDDDYGDNLGKGSAFQGYKGKDPKADDLMKFGATESISEGGNAWDMALTGGIEIIQDCNDEEECIKRLEAEITGSNEPDEAYADMVIKDYIELIKKDGFDKVRHNIDARDFMGEPVDLEGQENEGNEFSKKVQDLKSQGAKKGTKFKTSDGEEHTLEGVAKFIHSFYDRDSGTFPKGPEGICTMVGKKFGEQAEQAARKMVERMAPAQEQGAEELEELERIKQLSGF